MSKNDGNGFSVWQVSESCQWEFWKKKMAEDMPFLLPMTPVFNMRSDFSDCTLGEVNRFICVVNSCKCGYISQALDILENQLIPLSRESSSKWHSAVIMWCAFCSLSVCDSKKCLKYAHEADMLGYVSEIPGVLLLKAIALRLEQSYNEAIPLMEFLTSVDSPLLYEEKELARAWMIESLVASGQPELACRHCHWLIEEIPQVQVRINGPYLAALFRLLLSNLIKDHEFWNIQTVIQYLDDLTVYEKPLIATMLQDVLPRPLKGTEVIK